MADTREKGFYKSVIRQIRRSRKTVTILFTDVEGSTRYWEAHGDTKGQVPGSLCADCGFPWVYMGCAELQDSARLIFKGGGGDP